MPAPRRELRRFCLVKLVHGRTRKGRLLVSVPPGVVTVTYPLVAPAGTLVVISVFEALPITARVPLKLTAVAPLRFVPRMFTVVPTRAAVGRSITNGPSPSDRLNTVPHVCVPS